MRRYIGWAVILPMVLMACTKEKIVNSGYTEASYQLTITGQWTNPAFGIPSNNPHFTPVVGMVHSASGRMFGPGRAASTGVESLAEDGNAFPLLAEIDSMITMKQASSSFILFFPQINGSTRTSLYVNSNFPKCSFMSMLAPTPDWFFGLYDFDLRPGGNWIADTTVNLYTWDAGTEDGDVFRQDNASTTPRDVVNLLTAAKATVLANGNPTLMAVAKARFIKQ